MRVALLFASTIFSISASGLHAQSSVTECSSVLKPDETKLRQNYALRIAYIDSINESNFEESKKNTNLSVVLDGVPIGASYSDFDQSRRDFKSKVGYELSNSIDTDLVQTLLSPNAVAAFGDCVKNTSHQPLTAFVEAATRKAIVIRVLKKRPSKYRVDRHCNG